MVDELAESFEKFHDETTPEEQLALEEVKTKRVELPGNDRNNTDFAMESAKHLIGSKRIFLKSNENRIIEITTFEDSFTGKTGIGFGDIDAMRMLNILEKHMTFYFTVWTKEHIPIQKVKSPSETLARFLLKNDDTREALLKLNRISHSKMPFLIKKKLYLPTTGYNKQMQLFVTKEAPEIEEIPLDKAKEIIYEIFKEFCFHEEIDRTMAIAGFLTPACRGLYNKITARTPIFMYIANRERAGKDFCAGLTGICYEGVNIENPPISTGVKNQNADEELRKKITSALQRGQKRMHIGNNKGYLDSSVLEQVTTSSHWEDRVLGANKIVNLPNEMDFSMSANSGISWTPDLNNRMRKIRLFLDVENPNDRVFANPDLDMWVFDHRKEIHSAIYTCIKKWYDAGMPSGGTFSSFSEWARVVGGIMNVCGFGDPTIKDKTENEVGGDVETIDMKRLFEVMHDEQARGINKSHTVNEVISVVTKNQSEGEEFFNNFDFDQRSGQTKFSLLFRKFVGRIFSGIKCEIGELNPRPSRIKYSFTEINNENSTGNEGFKNNIKPTVPLWLKHLAKTQKNNEKNEKVGNLGNLGNLSYTAIREQKKYSIGDLKGYQTLPTLPNVTKKEDSTEEEIMIDNSTEEDKKELTIEATTKKVNLFELIEQGIHYREELLKKGVRGNDIDVQLRMGTIYEQKPEYYVLL